MLLEYFTGLLMKNQVEELLVSVEEVNDRTLTPGIRW